MTPDAGPILLRPARAEELPALSNLCQRAKAVWGYSDAFMDACRAELTLTEADLDPLRLVVAQCNGVLAGVVKVASTVPMSEMCKLFVAPEWQHTGVGSALMTYAITTARAAGCSAMEFVADPGAAAFYERAGAVRHGEVATGSIPGRRLPRLVLPLT